MLENVLQDRILGDTNCKVSEHGAFVSWLLDYPKTSKLFPVILQLANARARANVALHCKPSSLSLNLTLKSCPKCLPFSQEKRGNSIIQAICKVTLDTEVAVDVPCWL